MAIVVPGAVAVAEALSSNLSPSVTFTLPKQGNNLKKMGSQDEEDLDLDQDGYVDPLLKSKKFKLLEEIGKGVFSKVFKCQNVENGKFYACKRLNKKFASVKEANRYSEIIFHALVPGRHPNILTMHGFFFNIKIGQLSLVFDLMDKDLCALIKRSEHFLPVPRVRNIMRQILRGLDHLHKYRIFHTDLKPENILIKLPHDRIKIADFGNAKKFRSANLPDKPFQQGYVSTRWYRAPECILTHGYYDHRIDIWSAGCIMYELLSTRPLFPGKNEKDLMSKIWDALGPIPTNVFNFYTNCVEIEREIAAVGSERYERLIQIEKMLGSVQNCINPNAPLNNQEEEEDWDSELNQDYGFEDLLNKMEIPDAFAFNNVKNLLKRMLAYDRTARPSPKECLAHLFFQTPGKERRSIVKKDAAKAKTTTPAFRGDENPECDSVDAVKRRERITIQEPMPEIGSSWGKGCSEILSPGEEKVAFDKLSLNSLELPNCN